MKTREHATTYLGMKRHQERVNKARYLHEQEAKQSVHAARKFA